MGKASKRKASRKNTGEARKVYTYQVPGRNFILMAFSQEELNRLIAIHGGEG